MKWLRNKIQKWIWEWDDDDTVEVGRDGRVLEDRKSTRLNSSHT